MSNFYAGVDVGATTVKIGTFSDKGELIEKWEIPTRKEEQGAHILQDIVDSLEAKREKCQGNILGIGMGIPGPVTDDGVVHRCTNFGWGVFSVKEKVIEMTGVGRVRISNDANIAALGEMWKGGGRGHDSIVMVTLGTGVGGGIIQKGRVLMGSSGAGGEIGHIKVEFDHPAPCGCGNSGCVEQYASATGVVRMAKESMEPDSVLAQKAETLTAKDVFDAAKAGDTYGCKVVDRFGRYLGIALSNVAQVVDPEAFVIGGGVSAAGQIILDSVEKYYNEYSMFALKNKEFHLAELGNDAGIYGARAAVIGGCAGTSNVLTGQMFNVPVLGTHAHSWIMSFPDEYTAFKTYARMYPNSCTLLVDTYDVLKSGVPNAIRVFEEMREEGVKLTHYGIRIDSGDLAYLTKRARQMLDEAGFPDAFISASSDLDEYLITSLKSQGCCIDSWGVGTNMITSKDCPAFGGVYKLAAVQDERGNFIPKIKLSENIEKITNPGNKTVFRIYEKVEHKIKADLICLADEVFDESSDLTIFDPLETWKRTKLKAGTYELRELLVPVFRKGECVYTSPSVMELRDICSKELDTLWEEHRRLINPSQMYVDLSDKLYDIKKNLLHQMSMEDEK